MNQVSIEPHGEVALLRLQSGVTNAIGPRLVEELLEATTLVKDTYHGLVLGGGAKFFCIGLDLPFLLTLDRPQMDHFWDRFDQALLNLYSLPIPSAAAINGHATAGGAILALTQDFRYMAEGRKLIGLNEVNIGVPVPFLADLILRQVVGDRVATQLMFSGELIPPDQARRAGLVDDLLSENAIERHALERITALAKLPSNAFSIIKQNRTAALVEQFQGQQVEKKQTMLDCWFMPEVQVMLHKAAEKF